MNIRNRSFYYSHYELCKKTLQILVPHGISNGNCREFRQKTKQCKQNANYMLEIKLVGNPNKKD
uniref:Uncharacterized protein n=1 Tax=Arundo donax TaxID=35708 RepID=A0A0A9DWC1_ARUDO